MYLYKDNMANRVSRFMEITLTDEDNGTEYTVHIKEPKLKVYKMFEALDEASTIDDITAVVSKLVSGNKEGTKFSQEWIEDNMSMEEIGQLFEDFTNWIKQNKTTNPN